MVKDKIQVFSAGQAIYSAALKELYADAGENAKLYIVGKGYYTKDDVYYETIKYEIRDKDVVAASGEITLPEDIKL